MEQRYYLSSCETCKQPLLYYIDPLTEVEEPWVAEDDDDEAFRHADLLWPSQEMPGGLPDVVRNCYRAALRIKPISPSAFAVQIRRALEAICDERGAAKGTLVKRLKDLALKLEIPPKLVQITDVIRVLGNAGAHDHAVVEYVYVAPHSLSKYRTMAKRFGKAGLEQSEAVDNTALGTSTNDEKHTVD